MYRLTPASSGSILHYLALPWCAYLCTVTGSGKMCWSAGEVIGESDGVLVDPAPLLLLPAGLVWSGDFLALYLDSCARVCPDVSTGVRCSRKGVVGDVCSRWSQEGDAV